MSVTRTFRVTVTNEYPWDDPYTIEDVKAVIQGTDCGRECEGIQLNVEKIEEITE